MSLCSPSSTLALCAWWRFRTRTPVIGQKANNYLWNYLHHQLANYLQVKESDSWCVFDRNAAFEDVFDGM
jgi:hypothetical protein